MSSAGEPVVSTKLDKINGPPRTFIARGLIEIGCLHFVVNGGLLYRIPQHWGCVHEQMYEC